MPKPAKPEAEKAAKGAPRRIDHENGRTEGFTPALADKLRHGGDLVLFTAAEVGQLLGLTEEGVRDLHRARRLRAVQQTGKSLRWRVYDVKRFIAGLKPEA